MSRPAYTVPEAMQVLGVSDKTIRRMLTSGQLHEAGRDAGKRILIEPDSVDAAALEAYVTAMVAFNAPLLDLQAEPAALRRDLPADADPGSYSNGWGVTIGEVTVPRQRVQTNVSRMALGLLRTHLTRGPISLDSPKD